MQPVKRFNDLILPVSINQINLADTLDCGQCFRFGINPDKTISGVAHGRVLNLTQTEDEIIFHDMSPEEFEQIWRGYFDLETDYEALKNLLSKDLILSMALEYAGGIRILRQDSFEALLSFIISQNNNIPRIKGSINKLCRKFGSHIEGDIYSFPQIEQLYDIKKEDLSDLGLGYRDDYIVDCVSRLKSGEFVLDAIKSMPIDDARTSLRTIKGIGPKVAECALLFGFYRVEAFPVDTWIKKALTYYYPQGFPEEFKEIAGIAQQYIFHYIRTCKDAIPAEYRKK